MSRIVSVDSGSSFLKITTGNNLLSIPTNVLQAQETSVVNYEDEIVVNDKKYYVGETAILATNKFIEDPAIDAGFHGGENQYIQMCYAFQQMGIMGEHELLVVSLPYSDCRNETLKNKLKARNKFVWKSVVKGELKEKLASFKEVKIYPQGIGALRLYTNNLVHKPRSVCLIDIGSCTSDIIAVQLDRRTNDYTYNAHASKSLREISVGDFIKKWAKDIKQAPGLKERKFSYFELTNMMKYNDFEIRLGSHPKFDAKPLFEDTKKWFTQEIYRHAKETLGDLWDGIEQVILTSGGAHLIDETAWECAGRTIKMDEWSNVKGQYIGFGGILKKETTAEIQNQSADEVTL